MSLAGSCCAAVTWLAHCLGPTAQKYNKSRFVFCLFVSRSSGVARRQRRPGMHGRFFFVVGYGRRFLVTTQGLTCIMVWRWCRRAYHVLARRPHAPQLGATVLTPKHPRQGHCDGENSNRTHPPNHRSRSFFVCALFCLLGRHLFVGSEAFTGTKGIASDHSNPYDRSPVYYCSLTPPCSPPPTAHTITPNKPLCVQSFAASLRRGRCRQRQRWRRAAGGAGARTRINHARLDDPP